MGGKRKRNRPTEYAETEKEAYDLLKRLQAKYLAGDDMMPSKQTVESFLLHWLDHVKATRSNGTYGVYETRCRVHIIPAIGGLKLRALKTAHVQTMLDTLADTPAPGTVKDIRATIIKALTDTRKWGEVKHNVAIDTESRPLVDKRPPSLTDAQLDRLLEVISGHAIEPLVLVALGTGSRISECLGLLWAGVNEDTHELHITGAIKRKRQDRGAPGRRYLLVRDPFTKTRDQHTTHLAGPVAEALRQQWQRQQL